jgi:NitT/TauT family transport system ATP-binding protein
MTKLEFDSVSKSFTDGDGQPIRVLEDISFVIEEGSFTSIMGPSGCGKTTILNTVAGILDVDSGVIKQDGLPKNQDELSCSYVFQEPRLMDWETVEENIEFALAADDVPEEERDQRIETHLEKVGLAGEEDSYPAELSGGMQQRVGIARALAVDSDLILMDEPFSSLDEITASTLRADLLDIWRGTDTTILFVTHNVREAIFLSDRVLFLSPESGLFHDTNIELERPRDMDDPALMRRESDLTTLMQEELHQ